MKHCLRLLPFLLLILAGCSTSGIDTLPDPAVAGSPSTLFADISRAAGVTGTRQGNDRAIGQAWGDYNRDGWVDFYVTDTTGPNTLFRNNGNGSFSRSPLTEAVALPEAYSGGASFADFDNDGWLDLYVVNWGANLLFRNENGRGFTDITAAAGVGDEANGQTASWGDYDQDGWLDLYVANWACYPRCGRPNRGDSDKLYRNNGDGTFEDVTALLNGHTYGAGFVASFIDYDNDGDPDIYLVNDEFLFPTGNKLWRNDGPGCDGHCFTEISTEAGADTLVMGMGLATTDYDNDGDFDFYFSNAGPMALLQNQGDGSFVDVAPQAGVEMPTSIAWGTVPLDYNNDGWQDLYLAVMTTVDHKGLPANPLFHNNGDGTFTRVASGSGAADIGPSMGVATADFDRDGWVDLLVGNKDDGYRLLRNQTGAQSDNHWLTLELVGGGPVNRDAVGTRVTVTTTAGVMQLREVQNGGSLGAGNELALHFGLGPEERITELNILWPDGRTQTFSNIRADRRIILPYPTDPQAAAAQIEALYPKIDNVATQSRTTPPTGALAVLTAVLLLTAGILWRHTAPRMPGRPAQLTLVMSLLLVAALWLSTNIPAVQPQSELDGLLLQAGAALPERLPPASPEKVALGRALFWDPLLSGTLDTSCATCHHPDLGTGDGVSLPLGVGGEGLGPERVYTATARRVLVPRNATPIYNLALEGMDVMFWDGRAQLLPDGTFRSPADDDLPVGLDNIIAAQAMFPVTSREEMRGQRGSEDIFGVKNELARIKDHQWPLIWSTLMDRILTIPAYQELFQAAYPQIPPDELGFEHAANAMAAYQMETFTFLDSPWDRYLLGDNEALSPAELAGAELFYGAAGCAECHSGPLLTDLRFHNIGVPQVGPGKGFEEPLDFGRARETGDENDLFAFRTPPLRNVALTAPYMHNGAYLTLEAAVRHHLNPPAALAAYDVETLSAVMLEEDSGDPEVHRAALEAPAYDMPVIELSEAQVADLLAFLNALTSPTALDLSDTIPESVPSGLPVGGTIP